MKKRSAGKPDNNKRDRPSRPGKTSGSKSGSPRKSTRNSDSPRGERSFGSSDGRPSRPRPTEGRSDDRRTPSDRPERRPYGERTERPSGDRPERGGEGRTFDRPSYSDRPSRPRPSEGRSDDRRTPGDRPERRPYGERTERPSGDRPERGGEGRTFDRPSYSDRPSRPRPSEGRSDDRRTPGDRPERRPYGERSERPSGDRPERGGEGRTFDRPSYSDRPSRPRPGEGRSDDRRAPGDRPERRPYGERSERPSGERPERGGEGRTFDRPSYSDRPSRPRPGEGRSDDRRAPGDRPERRPYGERSERPSGDRPERGGEGRTFDRPSYSDRPSRPRPSEGRSDDRRAPGDRPERKPYGERSERPSGDRPERGSEGNSYNRPSYPRSGGGSYDRRPSKYGNKYGSKKRETESDGSLRLNRFLSNAGIASRREADTLITAGLVTVNGVVVTELGTKVQPTDDVRFEGQRIKAEQKVYLLLNKPTKYITTTDDPRERDTVMHLIEGACRERIYPVGRLDRNTTGVLLFTNDGDMAKKLTHPSHGAKKLYHVTLDKKVTAADMKKIRDGVMLQEGRAMVDEISYVEGATHHEVGIELHIGWNRVVRRIFEELGYEIIKLDRVMFAGLTKKRMARGHYRFLTEKEISILKML